MNGNEESAKAILSQVLYITLATVGPDGLPWNTPVYAAFDEEYQFFWVSASQVRHSQNIKATHRVAIVVYDSTAPAGTGKGVYIEARADEVTEEQEIIHALQALERRGWKKPLQEVMGASIHRVYKAVPEHISISTVGSHNGQLFDTRATVDLKEKKMNKVISKDGTPIAFDRSGHGPALILVSPATATRSAAEGLSAHLAPHFTVLAYDRRGRGDSGDTPPYAVEREVEDIDVLITEAGGSAFVFGHSSSAVLALEAARLLGGKIKKLAIYEPPFIIDDSRPPVPQDYVPHLNELIAAGRREEAVEYFMTDAMLVPAEMIAQMRNSPMWAQIEAVAHTIPTTAPSWEILWAAIPRHSGSGLLSPCPRSLWSEERVLRFFTTGLKRW